MKVKLSIQEQLRNLRAKQKDLTLEKLSQATGIATSTLGKYESDDYKDINHTYLFVLAKYYHVSADWLLGFIESREVQNYEIADLQLDDETLDILKSGRLNNRLLCEILKHPDFLKLMTDTKIYVDGIATMQIKNMNDWLNAVRLQIVQQHNPESNDLYLQVLDAARINEEYFFIRFTEIWTELLVSFVRIIKILPNLHRLSVLLPIIRKCSVCCKP
ncbi:MAG: helix-turn-helix domain-containing protein [Agathobacter sp.]